MQGLFGQDVLARLNRQQAERQVGVGRRADVYHLHLRVGDHLGSVGIDSCRAEFLGRGAGTVYVDVTDRDEVHPLVGCITGQVSFVGPSMGADHADAEGGGCIAHGSVFPHAAT